VRSADIGVMPPLFGDGLRFLQAIEDLSVQALIPEFAVKRPVPDSLLPLPITSARVVEGTVNACYR
jgi:hypothetical protein